MTVIEIEEKKVEKLSEHIEEGLRHMGKAMQCIEQLMEEGGMGERGGASGSRMSNRGGGASGNRYGNRGYGYRDEDDEEWEMQERRSRDSRGRYM